MKLLAYVFIFTGCLFFQITAFSSEVPKNKCLEAFKASEAARSCMKEEIEIKKYPVTIRTEADGACYIGTQCEESQYGVPTRVYFRGSVEQVKALNNCNGKLIAGSCPK